MPVVFSPESCQHRLEIVAGRTVMATTLIVHLRPARRATDAGSAVGSVRDAGKLRMIGWVGCGLIGLMFSHAHVQAPSD